MQHLKALVAGGMLVLTMALPLQASAAKLTPAQECTDVYLKLDLVVTKILFKGLRQVCKGKPVSTVASKVVTKVNKKIAKANKTHEKVDCDMNQDPDLGETWPIETVDQMDAESVLDNICDGV